MSRPKHFSTDEEKIRRKIIDTTYQNALNGGDKNVYYVEGAAPTEIRKNSGTVDDCHPNDLGFFSMAEDLKKRI